EGEAIVGRWERILALRSEVAQPLEAARKEKLIGSDQDALVTIAPGPFADLVETHRSSIREALTVSAIEVGDPAGAGVYESAAYPGLKVKVEKAPWGKCERCWNHTPEVGTLAGAPDLCGRCAAAVGK
ncbi:MAG: Isoleucyl-tRNA synthetase, partial [Deltaproteobacteria bacterium]|nr:Isoleucyl-tRNA synthetase [Deltaproteobacteria bacterium]